MVLNKKGQALMVGLMICVMVFITAIVLIEPMKELITIARNTDNLDCSNTSITFGERAACVIIDLWLPYFIGVVAFSAFGFVTWKLFRGGE